jgi:DNA polymerase (family 10)
VIASLHTSFDKSPTERIVGAMEHPHVHCIGHLLGRKIGRRAGSSLDVERVVEKAVETGTCLEIDSQPDRLDMPDFVARLAGEAGVPIAVTSDAHRLSALAYVELGIGQARRAWLTRQQVLNTRTWAQVAKVRK